jgi:hypothetical protein
MRNGPNLERRVVGKPDAGKSLQDFLAAWLGVSRRAAKAVIECTQNTLAAVLSSGQTLNTPGDRRA